MVGEGRVSFTVSLDKDLVVLVDRICRNVGVSRRRFVVLAVKGFFNRLGIFTDVPSGEDDVVMVSQGSGDEGAKDRVRAMAGVGEKGRY